MAARLLGLRPLLPSRTGHQPSIARLSRCFSGQKVVLLALPPRLVQDLVLARNRIAPEAGWHTPMSGGAGFHPKDDGQNVLHRVVDI